MVRNPKIGSSHLRLIFEIQQKDNLYQGTMLSPGQSSQKFKIDNISLHKDILRLAINQLGFTYRGVIKETEFIDGSFT